MVKENILNIRELNVAISKSIKGNFIYINDVYINNESYEYKILMEQDIDNVNKMEIEYDGNKTNLKYDISNKITLENYLLQKKLNVASLLLIIKNVNNLLNSISNYLLSENSITLDFRTIVIDKVNNKTRLKFCLVPNLNNDFSYELSRFLMKILRYIDINDKNALPLAYKLFIKSAKDNYTIDDLLEVVKQYENDSENLYDIYDENLIFDENQIVNEINEEKEDFYDLSKLYQNDDEKEEINNIDDEVLNVVNSKDSLVIDNATKELLDSFDEGTDTYEEKKLKEKKEIVHAHIKLNPFKKLFMPLVSFVLPISLYFSLSRYEFIKILPYILLFEIVLLLITIVGAFRRVLRK